MGAVMAGEKQLYALARLRSPRGADQHAGEIGKAGKTIAFDERNRLTSNPSVQVTAQRGSTGCAQPRGALLHHRAIELRHPRGGRPRARTERENVREGEGAFVDQCERVGKVRFGLRGEAGDEVGAERDCGTKRLKALTEVDRL